MLMQNKACLKKLNDMLNYVTYMGIINSKNNICRFEGFYRNFACLCILKSDFYLENSFIFYSFNNIVLEYTRKKTVD